MRRRRSLLQKTLDALNVTDLQKRRSAAGRLGAIRRNPGDLRGEDMLVGFACAGIYVSQGAGWIPAYQTEGCRIAEIAATLQDKKG